MAPTRELAQQIAEELTELTYFMPEVQVACVYGGANMESRPGVWPRAARSWWPPRAA